MKKFYLFLVLLLATMLRWYNNTAIALWHDEAFSAQYIKYGWGEMWDRIVLDVHPPLYYYVLRLWSYVFGNSLLSLRGMSILFGVLTVWAGYKLVQKAFKNDGLALLAALFLAINPYQIQYALEARMYTLGTFLVMLSSYMLLKALESRSKRDWLYYGLAAAAAFYTHYYLIFSILAQGLYALYAVWKDGSWKSPLRDNQLVNLGLAGGLAGLLYVPWLPPLLEQLARVGGGYWIPPMDRWSVPGTIWKIVMGGQGISRNVLVIATVLSLVLLVYYIRRTVEKEKWMMALGLLVPFAVTVTLYKDVYLDRYFVFASLYMSIMVAGALYTVSKPNLRRVMVLAFVGLSLYYFINSWSVLAVRDFGSAVNEKPGMAAAGAYMTERVGQSDRVYVGSSLIFFTYKYYNQTGVTPRLISGSPLKDIPHFAGTAIMTEDDLILNDEMFDRASYKKNDIVWLVWTTGWGGSKPNVPGNWKATSQESWTDAPGFKGEVYVTQYRVES